MMVDVSGRKNKDDLPKLVRRAARNASSAPFLQQSLSVLYGVQSGSPIFPAIAQNSNNYEEAMDWARRLEIARPFLPAGTDAVSQQMMLDPEYPLVLSAVVSDLEGAESAPAMRRLRLRRNTARRLACLQRAHPQANIMERVGPFGDQATQTMFLDAVIDLGGSSDLGI